MYSSSGFVTVALAFLQYSFHFERYKNWPHAHAFIVPHSSGNIFTKETDATKRTQPLVCPNVDRSMHILTDRLRQVSCQQHIKLN